MIAIAGDRNLIRSIRLNLSNSFDVINFCAQLFTSHLMLTRLKTRLTQGILLLLFSFTVSSFSYAQLRPLPVDGLLGTLNSAALPNIVVDKQPFKLSASAQIRNQKNMIIQVPMIIGPDMKVLYKKNRQRQIERMWLLTDREYQRIKHTQKSKK
jgi:hypothetical protein